MQLIFIHGAPATGKLTVAKALLQILDGRLFDNHTTIDLARTIFDFGAPGFWSLVRDVRMLALDAAAQQGVSLVVMTFCYSEPDDLPTYERFEALMQRHGGVVVPVFLSCGEDQIIQRIGNADRKERRKVSSMEGLAKFRAGYHDAPVPRADCLKLDTSATPADEVAQTIARHFGLAGVARTP